MDNKKRDFILIILTLGVFSISNTELGVIGILPLMAERFNVSITQTGLFVSLFSLAVAISGPIMPLVFSAINRKKMMVTILSIFVVCNLVLALSSNFYISLIARIIPAIFHPVYISLALSVAATSVKAEDSPKAVAKVMMGISAVMVIGVPTVSFIANSVSLESAMLTFSIVNALALIATIVLVPNMGNPKKVTYGDQLKVIKKPILWISILAVIFLNGSIYGVYSYVTEYLSSVSGMSVTLVSMVLSVYGVANIIGNMIGGRYLSKNPLKFISIFPFLLLCMYTILIFTGQFTITAAILVLFWGILAGSAANINQYWITSIVDNAPDFGNGLFIASASLGTTIGTTLCGYIISSMGIAAVILGGIIMVAISSVLIIIRVSKYHRVEKSNTLEYQSNI